MKKSIKKIVVGSFTTRYNQYVWSNDHSFWQKYV